MIESYYFDFKETGVKEIDLILMTIAEAGGCFHSVDGWTDECKSYLIDGYSCVDHIQNAANKAAIKLKTLQGG